MRHTVCWASEYIDTHLYCARKSSTAYTFSYVDSTLSSRTPSYSSRTAHLAFPTRSWVSRQVGFLPYCVQNCHARVTDALCCSDTVFMASQVVTSAARKHQRERFVQTFVSSNRCHFKRQLTFPIVSQKSQSKVSCLVFFYHILRRLVEYLLCSLSLVLFHIA